VVWQYFSGCAYYVAPAKPRRPAWNNAFAKNRYVEIPQELE